MIEIHVKKAGNIYRERETWDGHILINGGRHFTKETHILNWLNNDHLRVVYSFVYRLLAQSKRKSTTWNQQEHCTKKNLSFAHTMHTYSSIDRHVIVLNSKKSVCVENQIMIHRKKLTSWWIFLCINNSSGRRNDRRLYSWMRLLLVM